MRVRPGKGSRPRTRIRPAHEDAVEGFVIAVDRGRYTCLVGPEVARLMESALERRESIREHLAEQRQERLADARDRDPDDRDPDDGDEQTDGEEPEDTLVAALARERARNGLSAAANRKALRTKAEKTRQTKDAPPENRVVVAMKARELGRKGIVVGDWVSLVGDVSGTPDTLARVVRVETRTSMLRRSADDTEDTDGIERPVVANADQLVIVTALADPPPRPRMIDRILVAAFDAGIAPLLCLTKADLASPDELLEL